MTPKEIHESYEKHKNQFHTYIDNIKRNNLNNIYAICNPTLIKNPYASEFPKRFFTQTRIKSNKYILFLKNSFKFYVKNFYLFFCYLISYFVFKIYYKKQRKNYVINIIDIFGLVDQIVKEGKYTDNYLSGLYNVFSKYNFPHTILLRLYGSSKNPFKLISLFKILNEEKKDLIFEYELLKWNDFIRIFWFLLVYPFKSLKLLQSEINSIDKIYNRTLLEDFKHFSFNSYTRYILGKNLVKLDGLEKIYSWSEFQAVERGFNYGIRDNSDKIELVALQFFLNYETYFNTTIDDLDYELLTSPHKVLVNGKYYIKSRDNIAYNLGVSLRYRTIFDFKGIEEERDILLLGSYIETDTKYMLECISSLDRVIFKNHPVVNLSSLGKLPDNITVSNKNIYSLFKTAKLTIGTASGTSVEAVACGVSVVIIASKDNLTANPLVEYGKGKIWDIAFSVDDVKIVYNNLLEYRKHNIEEIKEISRWYKDNFFIEPSENNIINAFYLKRDN